MLPLVLAGPIVRRVDARLCSFWVALREPATVTANVWPGIQQSSGIGAVASGAPTVARGSAPTVRFGTNLHVAVVTARAAASFQPGTIFAYDLSITADDPAIAATNLGDQRLLDNELASPRLPNVDPEAPRHLALGYVPGQLPSFVTPPGALADLQLAHASCRDVETDGPDAMGYLDHEVELHLLDPAARPQQLFLTGDQIYADHVTRCLLKPLAELAAELIGGAGERVRIGADDVPLTLTNFPAHRRLRLVADEANFTGRGGHSHLIGFGEYAAMYLLAWSTRVWRPLATPDDLYVSAATSAVAGKLTDWEECHRDNLAQPSLANWRKAETTLQPGQGTTDFAKAVSQTTGYREGVARMARLLANCATYMVIDDHEVTEDFNLNKRWRNRVVTRPLGRAILRNAVMAFTVFQGWGNDPRAFTRADKSIFDPLDGLPEPQPGSPIWAVKKPAEPGQPERLTNNGTLMKLTHEAFAGAGPYPVGDVAPLEALLGLNDPDTAASPETKAVFTYTVDGPRHRVFVLDTRTRRSYEGEGLAPPALLGKTLKEQLPQGPLLGDQEVLVVVSAAPVLGPTILNDVVQPVSIVLQDLMVNLEGKAHADPCKPGVPLAGAELQDAEGWNGQEPAMEELLQRLATYPSVVILSGDVHFSSSAVLDYWSGAATQPSSRIIQCTSSGARAQAPGGPMLRPVLRAMPFGQGIMRGEPVERLAWKEAAAISLPAGASITPGRRARMLRSPALVPAGGWPAHTTVTTPPDWRWRSSLLRDERGRAELPVSLPPLPPVDEFDPADSAASFAGIVARHALTALDRRDQLRVCVFSANVATVSFQGAGPDARVRHTIFSEVTAGAAPGAPNTAHEVPIHPPPGDPGPSLQTEEA
jgi:hypothetical protein